MYDVELTITPATLNGSYLYDQYFVVMSEIHAIYVNNTSGRPMAYRHRLWHSSVMEYANIARDLRLRRATFARID